MTALRKHLTTFTFSALLVATPLATASAQAVEDAVERLKAYSADYGIELDWDRLDVSGSDATLVGARVGVEGEGFADVGDIELQGVSRDDKGYRISSIALDSYALDDAGEEAAMAMTGLVMGNVLLPDEAHRDDYGGFLFYETANIEAMTMTVEGVDIFTMNDLHVRVTAPDDDKAMDFTGTAGSFTADLSVIEDKDQLEILRALGYERLQGNFQMAGSWNPGDGRAALSRFDFAVHDAGTLGLSFELGGYTPALVASLRSLQKQIADNPKGDNSAQGLAILGLLQQLSFNGAEISFTDDTLTGKVLEFVAGKQGIKPADVANQAKAVAPFVLAQLNNPELTAQASQAIAAFLDNPGSLRISAQPASPVPFALLAATAMATPAELTRSLAVSISANE